MKLKLDKDGHVVVENGMPVYEHDDGKEESFNAKEISNKNTSLTGKLSDALEKITNLDQEKTRHFTKAKSLTDQLKPFEGMDPVEAKAAIEKIKTFKNKDLIDAGKVEEVKTAIKEQYKSFYEKEIETLKTTHSNEMTVKNTEITDLTRSTEKSVIFAEFAKSPHFTGTPDSKTILPADFAYDSFGKDFKLEGEGTNKKIVAYVNGEKLFSKENVGETAKFEEAIAVMVKNHPTDIKNTTPGGSGAGAGDGKQITASGTIKAGDQAALEANLPDVASGKIKVA